MSFCERICSSDLTRVHWRGTALLPGAFSSSELTLSDESASALGIHSVGKRVCLIELEMSDGRCDCFFNSNKKILSVDSKDHKRDLDSS